MSKKLIVGLLRADYESDGLRDKIKCYAEKLDDLRLDVFVAPEYSFFNNKPPMSETEFKREVKELAEKTKGKRTLVLPGTFVWYDEQDNLYNTLPIIQNGRVVLKYDKKESWGEADKMPKKNFRAGSTGGVFKWNPEMADFGRELETGVEICLDHARGTLQRETARNLDLQFVVSAGMEIQTNRLTLKDGGYVLLCDGLSPPCLHDDCGSPKVEVQKLVKNGKTEKIEPTKVENDELFIYELALDEEKKPSG